MLPDHAYRLGDVLHCGDLTIVRRGVRLADGAPVVLKGLSPQNATSSDIVRLAREFEILQRLAGPGIVAGLALEELKDGSAIVLEDTGGCSLATILAHDQPDLGEVLHVGQAVAAALGRVHAGKVIHKDVCPANIVWNRQTGDVRLIDFSISADLGREGELRADSDRLEGTLSYMSPEQTGRLDRDLDWRSDLYSFGATLYHLLTGRVPFTGEDAMAIVHGHLARAPIPPHELNPAVPPVLSAIVLKLLAKDVERRYQSAAGLQADLETCARALAQHGRIADFPLGLRDRTDRFRIAEGLYGRSADALRLEAACRRAAQGGAELVLLAGGAGVGKSALVREVRRRLAGRTGAFFVEGKFDQIRRNGPYSAVIEAFADLARLLLAEPDPVLAARRAALVEAVGVNGGIITDLIPEFAPLLGPQPPVPPLLPAESEFRFLLTFENMVRALVAQGPPLVLFLDDLQWADRPTLILLGELLAEPNLRHLLVIGAYRAEEVAAGHPLAAVVGQLRAAGRPVETIELGPLGEAEVLALVADTVGRRDEAVQGLASLCLAKTHGNPFFLTQFLLSLHASGLIAFEPAAGLWTWDAARIAARDSTDNVVALMVDKIQHLEADTCGELRHAACIGNTFDLATLAVISDTPAERMAGSLWRALGEGLILPAPPAPEAIGVPPALATGAPVAGAATHFRFLHDRVQQAAYSLVPEAEREEVHLRIGRYLMHRTPREERDSRLFDIVDQINRGRHRITDAIERRMVARLNLDAARRARDSAAFEAALGYARAGIELLGGEGWASARNLTFDLYEAAAEAAHMTGEPALMESLGAVVLANAETPVEVARIERIRVGAAIVRGDPAAALAIGLAALRPLGIRVPARPGPLAKALARLRGRLALWRFGGGDSRSLLRGDPRPLAALTLFQAIHPALHASRPDMAATIGAHWLEMALPLGDPLHGMLAYGHWAVVAAVGGAWRAADRHSRRALDLAERVAASELRPRVRFLALLYGRHWTEPLARLRPRWFEDHRLALALGNRQEAGNNLVAFLMAGLVSNATLAQLDGEVREAARIAVRLGAPGVDAFLVRLRRVLDGLTATAPAGSDTAAVPEGAGNAVTVAGATVVRLLGALILDGLDAVPAAAERRAGLAAARGTFLEAPLRFLQALVLVRARPAGPLDRWRARLRLAAAVGWFRRCAVPGSATHRHRRWLLEAEWMRLTGRTGRAAQCYAQAVEAARAAGAGAEEGLACERAADFYRECGLEAPARTYLAEARDAFRRWGAAAKVRELEHRHPEIQVAAGTAKTLRGSLRRDDRALDGGLDLAAAMKVAQAISSEIRREALLAKLMAIVLEHAGATRGVLVLNQGNGWRVEAAGEVATGRTTALASLPLGAPETDWILEPVILFVARTGKPVVLGDGEAVRGFADRPDPAGTWPRSLLCLPLHQQGLLAGMLYLENGLAEGVFTADRLEILGLISTQFMVSLENARLYEDLSRLNRTLERQIVARTAELAEKSRLLETTLQAMSDGIVVYDAADRLLLWNRRAMDTWKVPDHLRQTGTPHGELMRHVLDRGVIRRPGELGVDDFPSPGRGRDEVELADGRVIQMRRRPMPAGGVVQVFVDLTEERRREQELREARDAAEAAYQAKSEFVAAMSHEIRTPLNGILGMSRILLGTGLDERQHHYADVVQTSGERLLDLVNGILDFARLEAGRIAVERIDLDLDKLLGNIMALQFPAADAKGLRLVMEVPADVPRRIVGDLARVRQILLNLVANAIKFTERGGVTVTVRRVAGGAGDPQVRLRFAVADTGIGIPESVRGRLFQAYSQADPSITRRFGGTGLGLAICRRLVEALGGTIGYDSTVGVGSTFWFELDFAPDESRPEPAAAVAAAPDALDPPPPLYILVADDSDIGREVAKAFLTREGHQVDLVDGGEAAVAAVRDGDYDVVLMDIRMPDIDGLEATRRIRALEDPRKARLPVVALSANVLSEDVERYLAGGIDAVLAKPVDPDRLNAALAHLFAIQAPAFAPPVLPPAEGTAVVVSAARLAMLRDSFGADRLAGLLDRAEASMAEVVARLVPLWRAGDREAVAREAHKLDGVAATYGCEALAGLAAAIETAVRRRRDADLPALVGRLEPVLAESLRQLAAWRGYEAVTAPENL